MIQGLFALGALLFFGGIAGCILSGLIGIWLGLVSFSYFLFAIFLIITAIGMLMLFVAWTLNILVGGEPA